MLPTRIHKSLEIINQNNWLIQEILDQLEKDFGYPEIFDTPDYFKNLEDIFKSISVEVARMMKANPDAFYALLYKIDLNENKLKREMESGKYTTLEEVSSELVLERVIQKVITRNVFSKKLIV